MLANTDLLHTVKPAALTAGAVLLHKGAEHTVTAVTQIGRTYYVSTADDVLHFAPEENVTIVL